jgi:hypothetical protein
VQRHDEVGVVLTSALSVCSLGGVFPFVGGVFVGFSPCGKVGWGGGGENICQVVLLSSIIVELWRLSVKYVQMSNFGNTYWSMDYRIFTRWVDIYPVNRRLGGSERACLDVLK